MYSFLNRSLEATIRKHAGSNSGSAGAFSGKGQTLGGPAPSPGVGDVKEAVSGVDPQTALMGALLGIYLIYWYFNS